MSTIVAIFLDAVVADLIVTLSLRMRGIAIPTQG